MRKYSKVTVLIRLRTSAQNESLFQIYQSITKIKQVTKSLPIKKDIIRI